MRVCINPPPSAYHEDGRGSGGIWRVICAQGQWLPHHGVEVVEDKEDADAAIIHAGEVVDVGCPIVSCSHGLYWTGEMEWPIGYWQYNNPVIEALRRAHAVISPSEWVAQAIRQGMKISPIIIPHGIDGDDFEPPVGHGNYVLWAKPRVDVVSDPEPMNQVASLCPDVEFRSTFGRAAENVGIFGTLPYEDFQEVLSKAGVWLATTRETGDIASREAMAYGVPVVGWNWGATGELVRHLETGWLAKPGDYKDLAAGIRWALANRDRVGSAAREDVLARFQWKDIMSRYAAVLQQVLDGDDYPVEVSIVVPSYNYAQFLPECLDSVLDRTWPFSYEMIVVDDCSTDNTQEVLGYYEGDVQVVRHPENRGLPASLNTGHERARGRYIANLDADNVAEGGLAELYYALEREPWVDVATGPYRIMDTDRVHGGEVDVWNQLAHYNQIPSTCLIRSRSIRRIGGYRPRQLKNEDAEFWCRALSAGIRARKVTDEVVFQYRWHGENKSQREGGEDDPEGPLSWNFYCPWRVLPDIVPFGMLGHPDRGSYAVRSHESPHIAVIIACGPGHEWYLMDALDSVYGQTYREFECIVANDTGAPLDPAILGHPWVRVVDTGGNAGPARARNLAIEHAKAPLIVPLDADDMLYPGVLRWYYETWTQYPDALVYADCDIEDAPGHRKRYHSGPWSWDKIMREAIYQNVIFYPKAWWKSVGGYPEDISLWEDWLFGVALHLAGVGATYIDKPWGVYRHWTALAAGHSKSDGDNAGYGEAEFKEKLVAAQEWIAQKESIMSPRCPGCGRRSAKGRTATRGATMNVVQEGPDVMVICDRPAEGYFSVNSKVVPGRKYRFKHGTVLTVPGGDAWIAQMQGFRFITPEDLAPPSVPLPKEPPVVAPLIERPEPEPEPEPVSMVPTSAPHEAEKVVRAASDDLWAQILAIPRLSADKLAEVGLMSPNDVRFDVEQNNAGLITGIRGVGEATLNRLRAVLSAA